MRIPYALAQTRPRFPPTPPPHASSPLHRHYFRPAETRLPLFLRLRFPSTRSSTRALHECTRLPEVRRRNCTFPEREGERERETRNSLAFEAKQCAADRRSRTARFRHFSSFSLSLSLSLPFPSSLAPFIFISRWNHGWMDGWMDGWRSNVIVETFHFSRTRSIMTRETY